MVNGAEGVVEKEKGSWRNKKEKGSWRNRKLKIYGPKRKRKEA